MQKQELLSKKIVIYAHYFTTGGTEELRDWLVANQAREVVYIAFPFMSSKNPSIKITIYRKGKIHREKESFVRFCKPEPLSYLKDFIYGIWYGIRHAGNSDLFVGGDNLLTIAGVWLKKLGLIRHVIYYMIDYTPIRYHNKILNNLYYAFDRAAAYGADTVWPLIENTIEGRFRDGKLKREKVNWYAVPYGNHPRDRKKPGNPRRLVYMGGILRNKGAELFLPIAEELVKTSRDFVITLIGGGNYLEQIKAEIRNAGLEKYFKVYGFVEDFNTVLEILSECGIAIAPYYPEDSNSFTYYADAGKLKVYLGCGLPIVVTAVPPFSAEIQKEGAGLIAEYDAADIARKIQIIISSHEKFREAAWKLGEKYDWNNVLSEAFKKI